MTLTLNWVRQILLIIRDLRKVNVCLDFHSDPTDFASMADMFIVEVETELVKLVDFSRLFSIDSQICVSDFVQYLVNWCANFARLARSRVVNDHIPFSRVVFEVFGDELEHHTVTLAKFDDMIRDTLEHLATFGLPRQSSSVSDFSIIVDEFGLGAAAFGSSAEPLISQVLGIKQSVPLVSTMSGSVELIVTDKYPHGATLVHIPDSPGNDGWGAFRHLRSTMRLEEYRIPYVLDIEHRLDDSVYIVLNATGDSLSSVFHEDSERIDARVADQITEVMERIIGLGVVAGLADLSVRSAAYALLELFLINETRDNVQLVFLGDLRMVRGAFGIEGDALMKAEMEKVRAVIDALFVSRTLRSADIPGSLTFPGLVDEDVIISSHPFGRNTAVGSDSLKTTGINEEYGHFFPFAEEEHEPLYPPPPLETVAVPIQPTTVEPTGSFRVSLRSGSFVDISDSTDQPSAQSTIR